MNDKCESDRDAGVRRSSRAKKAIRPYRSGSQLHFPASFADYNSNQLSSKKFVALPLYRLFTAHCSDCPYTALTFQVRARLKGRFQGIFCEKRARKGRDSQ